MGQPVYRVAADGEAAVAALHRHVQETQRGFYYAKIDTDRTTLVRMLERLGFSVVDTNVVFRLDRPPLAVAPRPAISIHDAAGPEDKAGFLDIAETAFRFTRFHLDSLVGTSLAGRIKREWLGSYLERKRGDRLFLAKVNGEPAGFLAALV